MHWFWQCWKGFRWRSFSWLKGVIVFVRARTLRLAETCSSQDQTVLVAATWCGPPDFDTHIMQFLNYSFSNCWIGWGGIQGGSHYQTYLSPLHYFVWRWNCSSTQKSHKWLRFFKILILLLIQVSQITDISHTTGMRWLFSLVIKSFPAAVVTCHHSRFHVKCDSQCLRLLWSSSVSHSSLPRRTRVWMCSAGGHFKHS
jgi:hypothetical protein